MRLVADVVEKLGLFGELIADSISVFVLEVDCDDGIEAGSTGGFML